MYLGKLELTIDGDGSNPYRVTASAGDVVADLAEARSAYTKAFSAFTGEPVLTCTLSSTDEE